MGTQRHKQSKEHDAWMVRCLGDKAAPAQWRPAYQTLALAVNCTRCGPAGASVFYLQ